MPIDAEVVIGLDQIEVDVPNAVVTVGPGVTWAALRTKLMEVGLRTPFWGPFSGLVATVGGSVSQNAISHGSGQYGPSAPSVLGMVAGKFIKGYLFNPWVVCLSLIVGGAVLGWYGTRRWRIARSTSLMGAWYKRPLSGRSASSSRFKN